jgi:hypothetical protein
VGDAAGHERGEDTAGSPSPEREKKGRAAWRRGKTVRAGVPASVHALYLIFLIIFTMYIAKDMHQKKVKTYYNFK